MRKFFSLFAALTLSVGLWAETVSYLYPVYNEGDATKGIQKWETATVDANEITSTSATLAAGWYVVKGTNVQTGTLTCQGAVHIILADGAKLTATGTDNAGINVTGTNSLTIYAQSTNLETMGQLTAIYSSYDDGAAGIGGGSYQSGSNITINGGVITATCSHYNGAGIGGGYLGSGSNITINGGIVTATGGSGAAGIGGGETAPSSNIIINGGTVKAKGGTGGAAAIGGGHCSGPCSGIYINGGTVEATYNGFGYGSNMAIGCGMTDNSEIPDPLATNIFVATTLQVKADNNNPPTTVIKNTGGDLASELYHKPYVTIEPKVSTTYLDENGETKNIDAWEVKDASEAVTWGTAGETTWYVVNGTNVQLSKGAICNGDVRLILADNAKLTATGWLDETDWIGYAGIQVSGPGNSLTIYAQSTGETMGQLIADATSVHGAAGIGGGELGGGSYITINGGEVEATGGYFGAGIGGGNSGSGSYITINGGKVTATGQNGGAGIGGGFGGSGSNIYISDAYVLKAGANADNTEVIAHSSAQDLGSTLTQNYVKIEGLATPYTRTTSVDQWATVCLPYAASSFSGADFYKVNYYDGVDKLYIEPVDNLLAGVPYIFHTTATTVTIEHNATAPEAVTAGDENGLYGSFARKTIDYDADHAFAALANNTVNVIEEGHTVTVPACRAYFDMKQVPTTEQPHSAPLRCIGVPRQTPTSLDKTLDTKHQTQKLLHNGQFVIIRDGKTYNAQGQIIQ